MLKSTANVIPVCCSENSVQERWQCVGDFTNTALKILLFTKNYDNELECYKRLLERNIDQIYGFTLPRLVGYDDFCKRLRWNGEPPRIIDLEKFISISHPIIRKKRRQNGAPSKRKSGRALADHQTHLVQTSIFRHLLRRSQSQE